MGVYIPCAKRPEPGTLWNFVQDRDTGEILIQQVDHEQDRELQIIPVPPHGRLIDADALISEYAMIKYDWSEAVDVDDIKSAPTIIPAEEVRESLSLKTDISAPNSPRLAAALADVMAERSRQVKKGATIRAILSSNG